MRAWDQGGSGQPGRSWLFSWAHTKLPCSAAPRAAPATTDSAFAPSRHPGQQCIPSGLPWPMAGGEPCLTCYTSTKGKRRRIREGCGHGLGRAWSLGSLPPTSSSPLSSTAAIPLGPGLSPRAFRFKFSAPSPVPLSLVPEEKLLGGSGLLREPGL